MATVTDNLPGLVELCWRDGHLYGARPETASRTLTVRGKRRSRIRLQSDICRAMLTPDTGPPHYPDLWLDICDLVHDLREASA